MILKLIVTYFCLCFICVGKWKENSNGTTPIVGLTMACDPKTLPLGTVLFSPARREFRLCETKGGLIKGRKVDILVHTHEEGLEGGIHEEEWAVVGEKFHLPLGEIERLIEDD